MAFDPQEWELDSVKLGSGYFADVYAAVSVGDSYMPPQRAAFKILKAEMGQVPTDRFLAEMAVLAEIRGIPYVAAVFGAGRFKVGPRAGRLFIAMELADGSLADGAQDWSWPSSQLEITEALAHMASGVAGLHHAGFLHGDLKRDNVLRIANSWKLSDFNVSAALVDNVSKYYGSTAWTLPPESGPEMPRSPGDDIWALGVLITEMSSGAHPFAYAGDLREATVNFGRGGPGPYVADVPEELRPIASRCLVLDPSERPSAQQAADLLTRVLLDLREGGDRTDRACPVANPAYSPSWVLAAAATGPGRVEVVTSRNGAVSHHVATDAGWASAEEPGFAALAHIAGVVRPAAAAASEFFDGNLSWFPILGARHELWNEPVAARTDPAKTVVGAAESLPGVVDVAVGSADFGHVEAFALTADGGLHHTWRVHRAPYQDGEDFSGWQEIPIPPDGAPLKRIAVASDHGGHSELFAIDAAGRVWHRWLWHRWLHGGTWSDWETMHLQVPGARAISAASGGRDHLEVFVVGGDGTLRHRWWNDHADWADWHTMWPPQPEPFKNVVAAAAYQLPLILCLEGESGQLWWRSIHASWTWSDWSTDLPPI